MVNLTITKNILSPGPADYIEIKLSCCSLCGSVLHNPKQAIKFKIDSTRSPDPDDIFYCSGLESDSEIVTEISNYCKYMNEIESSLQAIDNKRLDEEIYLLSI